MIGVTVKLSDKEVGTGKPVFVICEAGVTNYGQLELAKKQIDEAVEAGADAVKFQFWKTENLVSRKVAQRLELELGYDWFLRLKSKELSRNDMRVLQQYAKEKRITFFATPHDEEGLDFLDSELDIPFLKVGSGEAHSFEFLEKVGRKHKPVIISFGLQSDGEAVRAVKTLQDAGARGIVALHCVTMYPTPYHAVGLPRIRMLEEMLKVPVGISDHTVGWHVPLAAVAMGAVMVEKHITFDKNDPRSLDNPGALMPQEFKRFVKEIRDIESARQEIADEDRMEMLAAARDWAGQSIVARNVLKPGTIIAPFDLSLKRPAKGGLGPEAVASVIGRRVKIEIPADEQIRLEDLESIF